jgi:hypothetical protein
MTKMNSKDEKLTKEAIVVEEAEMGAKGGILPCMP